MGYILVLLSRKYLSDRQNNDHPSNGHSSKPLRF